MSTPTDALIEKMARAIAESHGWKGWTRDDGDVASILRQNYRATARVAYEAEHEADLV
jgi:hypothetical protein